MKEKLTEWMNSRRYNSHLMRLLVGGYVVYLGGQIMVNQYRDGAFSLPLSLCAVLLIILGLPVAIISLYAVYNGYSVEYQGKTNAFQRSRDAEPEEDNTQE